LRTLIFEDGVASLTFTDIKAKDVTLTIEDSDVEKSIDFTFEEALDVDPDEFNLLLSETKVEQGNKVGIVIEALYENNVVTNYKPSDDFSFTINEEKITLDFSDGIAETTYITDILGKIAIKVSEENLEISKIITVEEKTEEEEEEDNENEIETNNGVEVYNLKIIGESLGLVGNPITLVVKAYDEDENLIKDFVPAEVIKVESNGEGVLEPNELNKDNFINGVATISYLTSEEENVKISVGEESFEIGFINKVKKLVGFEVTHDGSFIVGMPETITIQAVDEDDNATSYTAIGTVKLTLIDGEGTIEPSTLTANDFNSGKTEITFTATKTGSVKIKAQNGTIIGISHYLNADEDGIFSDVDSDHEFAEAISYLKNTDIVSGYDDGSFKPDKNVSRVEALKMIIGALSIELANNNEINFPDTESPSWYSSYVATGLVKNIVAGYPDGTFRPSNKIIRAEYLKILLEAANVELIEKISSDPYDDVDSDTWYAKYAEFSQENELFNVENEQLLPSQSVTRGEVADTLYKVIQLLK